MFSMPPTLVVFDVGGVLVRIRHTWDDILSALGETPPARDEPWPHAEYAPLTSYQDGSLDEDAYLLQLGSDLGLTPEKARRAHAAILESDFVGSTDLVCDLKAKGVKTACLSNTNALHWATFLDSSRHPSIAALDRRFASFEMRVNKPQPEAFRIVEAEFPGMERKIFFDDSMANVAAAIELGWQGYRVDPDGDPPAQMRRILRVSGVL